MGKGQMEIMGLLVIVILITLGVLFAVRFVLLEPEGISVRESYVETQLAVGTVNALRGVTADDCFGQSLESLYQDCAEGPNIICQDDAMAGRSDSCTYVYNALVGYTKFDGTHVPGILTNTFDKLNRDYHYVACRKDPNNQVCDLNPTYYNPGAGFNSIHPDIGSSCLGERERTVQFIPLTAYEVMLRLDICSN